MTPTKRRERPWRYATLCVMVIFLAICLTPRSAKAFVSKKGGNGGGGAAVAKKLEHMVSRGPVVTFSDGNFTRYTDAKVRPYHLVLLFTAMDPSFGCTACRMIEGPFRKAAKAYADQHDIRKDANPVVFARVDIANSRETYVRFDIQTAPHAYLVPIGVTIPTGNNLAEVEVTRGMSAPDGSIDDFLHDLFQITGAKVIIVPDTSGLLEAVLLLGGALGIASHFFSNAPSKLMAAVRCRGLWFLVSIACYMTGIGGMIYCIIRNPKSHGFDQRTGEATMFSQGARDQYWYEGVVVALFYVGMSAAIMGAYASASWKRAPAMVRTTAVLVCLTVLCYLSVEFFQLYARKTTWYSLPELLPPGIGDLHKGPIKRKHGLLKRLVRVSHLWLNEFTGMQAFLVKLQTLLWGYLVRSVFAFS